MQQAPEAMTLKVIAHIHTAFPTKFGIPRQSGLVEELRGEIVFTPEYRNPDALRGLEDFSHQSKSFLSIKYRTSVVYQITDCHNNCQNDCWNTKYK